MLAPLAWLAQERFGGNVLACGGAIDACARAGEGLAVRKLLRDLEGQAVACCAQVRAVASGRVVNGFLGNDWAAGLRSEWRSSRRRHEFH